MAKRVEAYRSSQIVSEESAPRSVLQALFEMQPDDRACARATPGVFTSTQDTR